ncbi:hypothetical protein [Paludisphaera sp.]|uniref:hypothetical protein n=1 Tax=Paludisphaera sp. TaxID=2017432 RepID=UPI00301E1C9E
MSPDAVEIQAPARRPRSSLVLPLSLALNAVLLAWVAHGSGAIQRYLGDGVSLVLANDTATALASLTLDYPGGSFKLPELPAGKGVGTSIPLPGEFEADLSFKDASGEARSRTVRIRPIGDLLVVIHVLPAAPTDAAEANGGEADGEAVPSPAPRVIVAYQGENTNP